MKELLATFTEWALSTGVQLLISIVILLIGFRIINIAARKFEEHNDKYDKTIVHTACYVLKIVLKGLLIITIIDHLGYDTSSLSAVVASLGVCFGLAVNGALANLAGGVLIIITRPFRIDDFIETQGITGTVEDIHIISTKIRTNDNKIIYMPNGTLINGNIINYSEKETRRVDFTFSIGYANDFEQAKRLVLDVCSRHELVLLDPLPFVRVVEHGASSINLVTRVWTKTENYWDVYFDLMEAVKKTFDENGIEIPFEQLDVHVKNQ